MQSCIFCGTLNQSTIETIKHTDVSKSYGRIMALDRLNLTVSEGEIYGFIGPNGAGKSTTIRLLLNFLNADHGKISVLGYSPAKDHVAIKKLTGYVSSDTFMYQDMKVHDLLRFTEKIHGLKDRAEANILLNCLILIPAKDSGNCLSAIAKRFLLPAFFFIVRS